MPIPRNPLHLGITLFGIGTFFCLAFSILLHHRTDYVGHFAAGYGGTLGLLTVVIAICRTPVSSARIHQIALLVALISIGIGTCFEATIFKIAQFDIVDLCNQSIGAILAALAFTAARPSTPLPISSILLGLTASIVFLIAGFKLAFA